MEEAASLGVCEDPVAVWRGRKVVFPDLWMVKLATAEEKERDHGFEGCLDMLRLVMRFIDGFVDRLMHQFVDRLLDSLLAGGKLNDGERVVVRGGGGLGRFLHAVPAVVVVQGFGDGRYQVID